MKRYRVYVCEMMEVEGEHVLPDDETEVVVKIQDYNMLATAIDLHQRQFLRVCLERDRLQRKVFELQGAAAIRSPPSYCVGMKDYGICRAYQGCACSEEYSPGGIPRLISLKGWK